MCDERIAIILPNTTSECGNNSELANNETASRPKGAHAELAIEMSTMSAEKSDILSASSVRSAGIDPDNPARRSESLDDGIGADRDDNGDEFGASRSGTPMSRTTVESLSTSVNHVVSVDEDDEEVVDEDDDDDRGLVIEDKGLVEKGQAVDIADDRSNEERIPIVIEEAPKLRLNVRLASDPALQPHARDIKFDATQQNESPLEPSAEKYPIVSSPEIVSDEESPSYSGKTVDQMLQLDIVVDNEDEDVIACEEIPKYPPLDVTMPLPARSRHDVGSVVQPASFRCEPCNIKFSSISTLKAHQDFYCSHTNIDRRPFAKDVANIESSAAIAGAQLWPSSRPTGDRSLPKVSLHRSTGRVYECMQCSFVSDKKVSLNRHMRIHQTTSPATPAVTAGQSMVTASAELEAEISSTDGHCTDCDIRFSSAKTFRAHKLHYCSARRRIQQDGSMVDAAAETSIPNILESPRRGMSCSPTSPVLQPTPQPYLALLTTPIVIIPYSLIRCAKIIPGPMPSLSPNADADRTCFVIVDGQMQPIAQSIAMPLMSPPLRSGRHNSSSNGTSIGASPPSPQMLTRPRSCTSVGSTSTVRRTPSATSSILLQPADATGGSEDAKDLCSENFTTINNPAYSISPSSCSFSSSTSMNSNPSAALSAYPLDLSVRGASDLSSKSRPHRNSSQQSVPLGIETLSGHFDQHANAYSHSNSSNDMANISPSMAIAQMFAGSAVGHVFHPFMLNQLLPDQSSSALSQTKLPTQRSRRSTNAASQQPQIIIKQGVSKCKECNIVFCKYENFVAHKKHYCSTRNPPAQPPIEVDPVALSEAKTVVDGATLSRKSPTTAVGHNGVHYQQMICAACGIKFTSLDTLNAHQMNYCTKMIAATVKPTPEVISHSNKRSAPPSIHPKQHHHHPQNHHHHSHKCPLCNLVSANAAEAKRHLDSHAGVKAFRCTICRYRGNTMRGMRTHIRMHFERKLPSADFNEEDYIMCVLEVNGEEVDNIIIGSGGKHAVAGQGQLLATRTTTTTAGAPTAPAMPATVHRCDECNYSSMYKGNVMRHSKLVHSSVDYGRALAVDSIGTGEGGESLFTSSHSFAATPNANSYSVNFKAEHLLMEQLQQHRVASAASDDPDNAKRIKLEDSLDDETTTAATTSSKARRQSFVTVEE